MRRRYYREPLEFSPIPEYGDLMTWEQFVRAVKCGALINYDGFGEYALADKVSNRVVYPSDIYYGRVLHGFTHVVWYNR